MSWTDKYKCEHEFERGRHINYYASPCEEDNFRELICTKCGYKTKIQDNHVDTFLAARNKKVTSTATEEQTPTVPVPRDDEPSIFKEIYDGLVPIPERAISHIDGDFYVDTMYATTIVEQAVLSNPRLISSPDYRSTYVSLGDLCEILDFIDRL